MCLVYSGTGEVRKDSKKEGSRERERRGSNALSGRDVRERTENGREKLEGERIERWSALFLGEAGRGAVVVSGF